jgi:hypothetical protein
MTEKLEYETPRASVRGVFLCDSVADTAFSPVRTVDVTPWGGWEDTTAADGGDVFLML